MTIGEKIVKLRKQQGMSQEAFSEKLDVSRQAVSKWENGTAQPTSENLAQISKLFSVSISYLLDDEDIHISSDFSTQESDNVEKFSTNKAEHKAFKISSVIQNCATVILAIAIIAQSSTTNSLRRDIDVLRQKTDQISTLKSQIALLESRVNHTPATSNDNFTDYSYKVIAFDRQTNTATIQFSVVPKDYSANTTAEIVVKGDNVYNLATNFENNIFTAQADIVCEDEMTVYLYLTDNGQTRSFVLGGLSNIARNYQLEAYINYVGGSWKLDNGNFKGKLQVDCTVYHTTSQSLEDCIYPKKAVINLYHHDKLIHQRPFESITDYDFVEDAKISAGEVHEIFSCVTTFCEYFDLEILDENITNASDILVEVVLVDNNGYEYIVNQPLTNGL